MRSGNESLISLWMEEDFQVLIITQLGFLTVEDRIGKTDFHCVEWIIMQPSPRLAAFIVQKNLPKQKGRADLQPKMHF